ncbi:MAG: thioredoxin family protein [Longimicrobiaceae bacterium]
MARTESTMLQLGSKAPDFKLPDTLGKGSQVSVSQYDGVPGLLVIFLCNHCPFVKHIREQLAELAKAYQPRGVAIIGINSNDWESYPDDSPEKMIEEIREVGYTFPYLYDETQDVAKAYKAACTPDFFLFDKGRKLVYRGQFDDSRPGNGVPVTGKDLSAALDALLGGKQIFQEQKPSIGCNIKWRPGNEPDYFGAR